MMTFACEKDYSREKYLGYQKKFFSRCLLFLYFLNFCSALLSAVSRFVFFVLLSLSFLLTLFLEAACSSFFCSCFAAFSFCHLSCCFSLSPIFSFMSLIPGRELSDGLFFIFSLSFVPESSLFMEVLIVKFFILKLLYIISLFFCTKRHSVLQK